MSRWRKTRGEEAAAGPAHGSREPATAPARPGAHPQVRGADAKARQLLQEGARRSVTFRALLETLEASDIIVYVETGALDHPAQLHFVTAGPHYRFLRIAVRTPGRDTDLVAWLAHELQHAVEISVAPDVRDQRGTLALYRRIGLVDGSVAETIRAQETWVRVREEARR